MIEKDNLSKRVNVFLAKKSLITNIYYTAKIEEINVNFSQMKTILDGVSVSNLDMDDVQKILNLRNAWKYTIDNLGEFNERLSKFYETNDYSHIIYFLYDNCVFGIDYND